MRNRPSCVSDTNSLISALLIKPSISRQAFDKALDHYRIIISDETAAESDDVAGREKFETYLKVGEREAFEELLHREPQSVEVTETAEASRDPDEDKFLELAVAGEAGVIISGDKDLLVLDPFRDVQIVRPRTFVEEFPPVEEAL